MEEKNKISLKDILNIRPALVELSNKHFINYSLMLQLMKLNKEIDMYYYFYLEHEKMLVDEYSSKDENNLPIILQSNHVKFDSVEEKNKFDSEIVKLQNTEIDINKVKIDVADFKNTSELPTPNEMFLLDKVIDWQ